MAKDEELAVPADVKEEFARVLAGLTEADSGDVRSVEQVKYDMVMDMLSAETEEQLWKELPKWSTKTSIGMSFEIRDARAWPSSIVQEDGSKGSFISCPAVNLDTGELGILNTSALRIAARVGWYKLHGKLPFRATVIERGKSSNGYPILDLELIEA